MTTLPDLTTDPFGYSCLPEQSLDAAFALGGKALRLPQTCLPEDAPRLPEVLAWAIGRPPTDAEWTGYAYRWCDLHETCGWAAPDLATTPLGGAWLYLAAGLAAFAVIARRMT